MIRTYIEDGQRLAWQFKDFHGDWWKFTATEHERRMADADGYDEVTIWSCYAYHGRAAECGIHFLHVQQHALLVGLEDVLASWMARISEVAIGAAKHGEECVSDRE